MRQAVTVFLLLACVAVSAAERTPLGLPPVSIPVDNAQTPEKVALGKRLFSDKRFSADGSMSCASCHLPDKTFTDGKVVAEGLRKQKGTRNSPTLLNTAYFTSQFWDGRRASLEAQAKDPFVNATEHGLPNHDALLTVVRGDTKYIGQFKHVFGIDVQAITIDHVTKAIAAFERTLVAGNSPFDRFLYANEHDALSPAAQRGLELFRGRASCGTCHSIEKNFALFTDNKFHSAGVGFDRIQPRLAEITTRFMSAKGEATAQLTSSNSVDAAVLSDADISELGRFVVTSDPADIGKFKTPSLRNIALTAPYMHDGSVATLGEVIDIELYVRGAEVSRPVILTPAEKDDLVEFLSALTSLDLK